MEGTVHTYTVVYDEWSYLNLKPCQPFDVAQTCMWWVHSYIRKGNILLSRLYYLRLSIPAIIQQTRHSPLPKQDHAVCLSTANCDLIDYAINWRANCNENSCLLQHAKGAVAMPLRGRNFWVQKCYACNPIECYSPQCFVMVLPMDRLVTAALHKPVNLLF